jgi:hypothetical protein
VGITLHYEIKGGDSIIVNEYDLVPTWSILCNLNDFCSHLPVVSVGAGASIGAKLAAPDKLVIATLGDGSYMFGNPTPCHFVSQAYELPTLTVIFNNRVWNACRANLSMYPNGWAAKTQNFPSASCSRRRTLRCWSPPAVGTVSASRRRLKCGRPCSGLCAPCVRRDGRQC